MTTPRLGMTIVTSAYQWIGNVMTDVIIIIDKAL